MWPVFMWTYRLSVKLNWTLNWSNYKSINANRSFPLPMPAIDTIQRVASVWFKYPLGFSDPFLKTRWPTANARKKSTTESFKWSSFLRLTSSWTIGIEISPFARYFYTANAFMWNIRVSGIGTRRRNINNYFTRLVALYMLDK